MPNLRTRVNNIREYANSLTIEEYALNIKTIENMIIELHPINPWTWDA